MAVEITQLREGTIPGGGSQFRIVKVKFDSLYPTGGEPLSKERLGLTRIVAAIPAGSNTAAIAHTARYNHQTGKLYVADAGGTQVVNNTDLSTFEFYFQFIG